MFITYKIKGIHNNDTPIAVEVKPLSAHEVYNDAISLHGLSNVRVNQSGRIRKDAIVINAVEHFKYNWEELSKQYYDKMFNPSNFKPTT